VPREGEKEGGGVGGREGEKKGGGEGGAVTATALQRWRCYRGTNTASSQAALTLF
jgi:hypothetical protein